MKQPFAQSKGLSPSLLTLSVRTCNCLAGAGLLTDDLLCMKTSGQLMKLRNFGRKCLREVEHYLEARGRRLADTPASTPAIKSDFHRHAALVAQLAKYPDSGLGTLKALRYCVLGLASEADTIPAPLMRGINEQLTDEDCKTLSAKLGNVLWYFFRCCAELGIDPEKVAAENIEKLTQSKSTLAVGEPTPLVQMARRSPEILTERQRIVFDFIMEGIGKRRVPTLREIGDHVGIRSIANIKYYIQILKEKGCLNMAEAAPLIRGVSYYRCRHLGHETPSDRTPITEGRKRELAALTQKREPTTKSKNKANPRVSTRSIAAELISIFERGNENDDQGEDGPSDSRNGAEVVRGAG